jgi:hypothetical protein
MLHDFDEEARMKRILEVMDKALRLSLQIDEIVGRLSEKRVTLEEKMIRSYFHQVNANLLELSAWFNRALAVATTPKQAGNDSALPQNTTEIQAACIETETFLDKLQATVDELLKVLRYDLNFVEQYFEFNFYGKLTNEDGFLPESQALLEKLSGRQAKAN